jgi:CP family cyanate transporter-like MFS transporter
VQVVSVAAGLGAPVLAARRRDQRPLVALAVALAIAGLAGCWALGATAAVVWAIALGLGSGAMLSLALMFFILRARDAGETARLSGMAQTFGYLLAATGPIGVGLVHDATGSWDVPLALLTATTLAALVLGLRAGRDRQVG